MMASGADVTVEVYSWGMNVFAHAPSEDRHKTVGLCGTFDGDASNDWLIRGGDVTEDRAAFVESWRYGLPETLNVCFILFALTYL